MNNRGKFTPVYNHKGESHTLKEWSRILKINYSTLRKRVLEMKLPFEDAITYIDMRDALIWYNGKEYTRRELCEKHGIPLRNFYDRTHKGWPLEKILNTPVIHKI